MLKQVIIIRQDLKLPKGKAAAQAAHAAVEAVWKSDKNKVQEWRSAGQKKSVVKVADEKELYKYIQQAKDQGFTTAVITDAGKTVIAPGTTTCAAIGPDDEEKIDLITGELGLY
jgi:PTH2 family peptidyl-tRNA hydrolase